MHKLGIPAVGCQLCAAPPWRFPAPLWPRFPLLYKEVGLGDLPGPFRSHKLALTPQSGQGQELQASREKLGKSEAHRPKQTHSQAGSLGTQGRAEPQPGADVRTWKPTNLTHRTVESEARKLATCTEPPFSCPCPLPNTLGAATRPLSGSLLCLGADPPLLALSPKAPRGVAWGRSPC